ncbi:MAG: DMT family transporter [Pseudomonadales bacterium]|nr:DMT family transporter [Pseudomonadales bacterium]
MAKINRALYLQRARAENDILNQMQNTDHHFKFGLFFALTAVVFWGVLPIALKLSATFIDPVTLTWFRFFVAFLVSLVLQKLSGNLYQFKRLQNIDWLKLTLAAIFSVFNYVSFVYALDYLQPGPAQLTFQTAPFFLAFGGMLFFKERLSAVQMTCFATLALGMLLFFHPHLDFSNTQTNQLWIGILIVQFSALSWTSYALLQKSMISKLSPGNILLYIYGAGLLLMIPFSDFSYFPKMDTNQWFIAVFCALNTLIAYGSFAQSMKYWPTAQVGATVTLAPVFSFIFTAMVVAQGWWPTLIKSNPIDMLSLAGIILVIGSVICVQLMPIIARRYKAKVRPSYS